MQSSPNMPLRDLFYISQLYGKTLGERSLYSKTPISLPAPNFIVFYNGAQKHPEILEYRLSDLYVIKGDTPQMELRVKVININAGCNERLVSQCKELKGYQSFVEKVRSYQKKVKLEQAIEQAVRECIDEGILKEFFIKYRKEIVNMSLWEFDQKKYDDMLREEGREEGVLMINSLMSYLVRDDRMDDLKQSISNSAYRNRLLQEYGLV